MKKITLAVLSLALAAALTSCKPIPKPKTETKTKTEPAKVEKEEPEVDTEIALYFDMDKAVKDSGSKALGNTSAADLAVNMKNGWNLGNTFDATGSKSMSSETSWGQPKTTKAMIDGLAASGIKTLRLPVSWSNHLIDKNYTIDPMWMNRVKEVVDWAVDDGMYVILNSHHDCWDKPALMPRASGYYPNTTNYYESARYLKNIWTQIGTAFNNGYDEHLVFETMNEPRLRGTSHEWWFDNNALECRDGADILNKLNQLALDTIRSTGGNNSKRVVSVPGLQASPDSAFAVAFQMPKDGDNGNTRLMLSVHMYSPYNFAMESPGLTSYNDSMGQELARTFKKLHDNFITKGYGVYIGEYGATNKNNLEDRVNWFHAFLKFSRQFGMPCILWDNGVWEVKGNDYNEHYGYYNRNEQKWYFPEITKAIIEETL